jgi:serine/threonine-protein kinase
VPDLHALRETIPVSVETVVKRALAKTPADRYQSAAKFADALASIPTRWSSGFRRIVTHDGEDQAGESIAVLPFVNMSSDEENEYFSDGMTEELIHALTKVDGLRVASRTSAFAFKGKDADAREIGRKLNVTTLLEGSVRKAGNKLRVAAQLIKVADGYHIWSETFERDLKDVFAVQDDIANRIVETLKLTLLGERKSLVVPPTVNVEAYNDYLRGRFHWNKRSEEALQRGIGCFGDAVRVDPHFALAYVGLADSYIVLGGYGYLPTRDAYTRAKAEAIKALEIDEDLAEAHTSLAYVRTFYDWDWAAADKAFRRAIELNPHYPTARQWYGQYLASLGRFDEAVATLRRALQLDPLSLPICASMGRALYYARRFDEAISQCRSALEMEPTFALAHAWLGMAYLAKKETPQAMAELEKAVELTHGNPVLLAGLGAAYAAAGERTEALKILAALKEEAKRRRVLPVFVAVVHGELGEADEAFRWLDVAYEERSDWLVSLKVSPWFDSLRHDARFDQLLRKMQLE